MEKLLGFLKFSIFVGIFNVRENKNNKEMKQTRPVPSVSKGVDMSKVKWTSEQQDAIYEKIRIFWLQRLLAVVRLLFW